MKKQNIFFNLNTKSVVIDNASRKSSTNIIVMTDEEIRSKIPEITKNNASVAVVKEILQQILNTFLNIESVRSAINHESLEYPVLVSGSNAASYLLSKISFVIGNPLSKRIYNCLTDGCGLSYNYEVAIIEREELLKLRNLGANGCAKIASDFSSNGVTVGMVEKLSRKIEELECAIVKDVPSIAGSSYLYDLAGYWSMPATTILDMTILKLVKSLGRHSGWMPRKNLMHLISEFCYPEMQKLISEF